MVNVRIDEYDLLEMLMERVCAWTEDEDVRKLFEIMYENMIYGGCFDGRTLDVMAQVDNDYINWYSVYSDEEVKDQEIDEDRIDARYNGYNLVYVG